MGATGSNQACCPNAARPVRHGTRWTGRFPLAASSCSVSNRSPAIAVLIPSRVFRAMWAPSAGQALGRGRSEHVGALLRRRSVYVACPLRPPDQPHYGLERRVGRLARDLGRSIRHGASLQPAATPATDPPYARGSSWVPAASRRSASIGVAAGEARVGASELPRQLLRHLQHRREGGAWASVQLAAVE